jgi:hypothetical protein
VVCPRLHLAEQAVGWSVGPGLDPTTHPGLNQGRVVWLGAEGTLVPGTDNCPPPPLQVEPTLIKPIVIWGGGDDDVTFSIGGFGSYNREHTRYLPRLKLPRGFKTLHHIAGVFFLVHVLPNEYDLRSISWRFQNFLSLSRDLVKQQLMSS